MNILKPAKKLNTLSDSPIEKAGEMLREPVREMAAMPNTIFQTALEQIGFKPKRSPMSGTIEIIKKQAAFEQPQPQAQPAAEKPNMHEMSGRQFQAQRSQEKVIFNQKEQETQKQIERVLSELKMEVARLGSQASALSSDIAKITVENSPRKTGVYHLNFLEALIIEIRNLRRKVTNSRLWLDATYAKKKKRGFWQMAKKHGNEFLLSEERTAGYGAG